MKIYLFSGSEELIIKNKIDKLIKSCNCDEYNISVYDLEEVNIAEVIQDATTPPFISEQKAIIIKNPLFLTSTKTDINHNIKMFIDYLTKPFASTNLIIDATNLTLDTRKEVVKKLLDVAQLSETKELTPVEAEGWLKRQFSINGREINNDAVKLFFNRIGKNLMNAKNEVDKLLNYIGERNIVNLEDVSSVVTREVETEAFALTNAIIDKDKTKTINIYHDLVHSGKDALQLLGLVSRSMCDILVVRTLLDLGYKQTDISTTMKVSSGRAYYLVKNAKEFSLDIIENNVVKLANLDFRIKSGQIEASSGLELFLFAL